MSILKNKIDFAFIISVNNANPNGDPLNGNMPRTDLRGYGVMSDVALKRKLRNALQDLGFAIFVQSDDRINDGAETLKERATAAGLDKEKDATAFAKKACETWIDVRSFGQLFAHKGFKVASVGVRGPVSIHHAVSVAPVEIESMQITKSTSGDKKEDGVRGSDTMGMKHFVQHGLYVAKGSISPQLAEKTGFTEEDAKAIKQCLCRLFLNDSSAARPAGSMEVVNVYWWEHNCKDGQYSSAKVHRSLDVHVKEGVIDPRSIDDYEITLHELEGLKCEVIQGM